MKKSLFLLPIALMLAGCGEQPTPPPTHEHTLGAWVSDASNHWKTCSECNEVVNKAAHADGNGDGKCDVCNYQMSVHTHSWSDWKSNETNHWKTCSGCSEKGSQAAHTFNGNICSVCGYEKQVTPPSGDFPGLTMNVTTLGEVEDKGAGGYSRLAGVTSMNNVPVSFTSVMTNGLNSESLPKWKTPGDEKVQVIQFKKAEGSISVTGKISKLTLKVYSSYSWAETGLPTISFNGSSIAKPAAAKATDTTEYESYNSAGTKSFALSLMTVEYAVNASAAGQLTISNTNSFALYFDSFILE